jgi:hypothetical protein
MPRKEINRDKGNKRDKYENNNRINRVEKSSFGLLIELCGNIFINAG